MDNMKFQSFFFSKLSGAHYPISLTFNFEIPKIGERSPYGGPYLKLWDNEKINGFLNNFDLNEIGRLSDKLNSPETINNFNQETADYIMSDIASLFIRTTEEYFGFKRTKRNIQLLVINESTNFYTAWFGHKC